VVLVLAELALVQERRNNAARAEEFYRECVAIVREHRAFDHPKVSVLVSNFATFLAKHGKSEEGKQLCLELLDAHRRRFTPKHKLVADALVTYAEFLHVCDDRAGEEKALNDALEIYAQTPQRPWRSHFLALLQAAQNYSQQAATLDKAAELLRKALNLAERLTPQQPYPQTLAQMQLAHVLMDQGHYTVEVGQLLDQADALCREHLGGNRRTEMLTAILGGYRDYYLRTDRLAESAMAATDLLKLRRRDPRLLYDVACHLAQCASRVGRGKAELTAAEQAERTRYEDLSFARLKEAVDGDSENLEKLRSDKRLDPLRSRKDFQEWLADQSGRKGDR
jgi:hypothetical protein